MLAVLDVDGHRAADAGQLARARVGYDHYRERGCPAIHDTAVMHCERSVAPAQLGLDALHSDVDCGAAGGGTHRQHLSLARAPKVSLKLLVDRHAAEHGLFRDVLEGHGVELHIERSSRGDRHGSLRASLSKLMCRVRELSGLELAESF